MAGVIAVAGGHKAVLIGGSVEEAARNLNIGAHVVRNAIRNGRPRGGVCFDEAVEGVEYTTLADCSAELRKMIKGI